MRILSAIFLALMSTSICYADAVVLKNGVIIEGKIIEKGNTHITINCGNTSLTYSLDEIDLIDQAGETFSLHTLPPKKQTSQKAQALHKPLTQGNVYISINQMIDLNGKTKKEIYTLRKDYVSQHPELVKASYGPSTAVFGQIVDRKPWWGILGLSYYGPGQRSIEGPAEESRFLANPFLLVGLDSGHALIVHDAALTPIPIYPEPTNLVWHKDGSQGRVEYDLSSFWPKQVRYHDPTVKKRSLALVAYNARDFGFNYLYIDPQKSKNAISSRAHGRIVPIRHYIHCGGSCGYPGGCNNMSPDDPNLEVKVKDTPALLYIKLWRKQPADVNQAADMVFVIEMT